MIENKLFEALLDVIPFKAYAVDTETYEVIYANKLMSSNMYSPQETYCWKKIFGQENICSWCSILDLGLRKKESDTKEKYTCEFFDESDDKWLKSYDELMSWPDGRDVKYSVLVDITDQKEIQGNMIKSHANLAMKQKLLTKTNKNLQITRLQLEKRTAELKIKNETITAQTKQRQTLLHILCHDLTNPSGAAKGSIDMVTDICNVDEKTSSYLRTAKTGLTQSLKIIDLTRKLLALDEKKLTLKLEEISLAYLLNLSLETVGAHFEAKGIKLQINVPENLDIRVDPISCVNSVINNLLTNAAKFSDTDSKVIVHAEAFDEFITLTIQDFGIGMPQNILEQIFDPSAKTNRAGTQGEIGTGFGMPLVKRFIEAYGGNIQVTSTDIKKNNTESGTTVILHFPR